MFYSIFKIIALDGSVVVGTGTIVNQVFFSETKEKKSIKETISITPAELPCTIYKAAEAPRGNWGSRRFTRFTDEFYDKHTFLKKIEEPSVWNKETLRGEIEKGCSKYGRAYVWYGPAQDKGHTWIYADEMNNGRDWFKEADVIVPSSLKQSIG